MSDTSRDHQQEEDTPMALLIEPCEADATRFEQYLRKVALHWRLIVVKDGFTAIQYITINGFPRLIVSCLKTSRLDAIDVAEWVRVMKSPRPVPIVIRDHAVPPEFKRQLQKFDVTEFLGKDAAVQATHSQLLHLIERLERESVAQ